MGCTVRIRYVRCLACGERVEAHMHYGIHDVCHNISPLCRACQLDIAYVCDKYGQAYKLWDTRPEPPRGGSGLMPPPPLWDGQGHPTVRQPPPLEVMRRDETLGPGAPEYFALVKLMNDPPPQPPPGRVGAPASTPDPRALFALIDEAQAMLVRASVPQFTIAVPHDPWSQG